MRYLRLFLLPLSWLYAGIIHLRNLLFDRKVFKSFHFEVFTVSVGNLMVGGTGKTPMIEYLVRLLKDHYKLAVLSRGYKRMSRGFRIAGDGDNALTIGDEPFQYVRKFGEAAVVSVSEDRVLAIPHLLLHYPDIECILLDDAFQHRQLAADLQILLSDYQRPFYKDHVFPAGNLREPRSAAIRTDMVIITKCPPAMTEAEKAAINKRLKVYIDDQTPVFFSNITYEEPRSVWDQKKKIGQKIILVTGIANPKPLVKHLKGNFEILRHFKFPDHHYFTKRDIDLITAYFDQLETSEKTFLFTEKDIARIIKTPLEDILNSYPVFFQPITYNFVHDGHVFDRLMYETIEKHKNPH